jgi:AcrR family transcriptional regulator
VVAATPDESDTGNLAAGDERRGVAWREYDPSPLSPVLEAALMCFMEQGYHGTSIRMIARRAGLSVPGIYHHFDSKHDLLVELTSHAMAELWERSQASVAEAGGSVTRQFDRLTECLVLFHAHRRELAVIAMSEIRSLEGDARVRHIAARDRQQRLMDGIVDAGVASHEFTTPYPREASRAIITMCTSMANWYHPDGPMTPADLAVKYGAVARMAVGIAGGAPGAGLA